MFRSENLSIVFYTNIFIILGWHLLICLICKNLKDASFDYNRDAYKTKYWENDGHFYQKRLKIKLWKDYLPQYISKNGFSKNNLDSLSIDYIDKFILETCRGEWAHKKCMLISVLLFFFNRFCIGVFFGSIVLFINLPYVCIQRYNRIRFLRIRKKLVHQTNVDSERLIKFAKGALKNN